MCRPREDPIPLLLAAVQPCALLLLSLRCCLLRRYALARIIHNDTLKRVDPKSPSRRLVTSSIKKIGEKTRQGAHKAADGVHRHQSKGSAPSLDALPTTSTSAAASAAARFAPDERLKMDSEGGGEEEGSHHGGVPAAMFASDVTSLEMEEGSLSVVALSVSVETSRRPPSPLSIASTSGNDESQSPVQRVLGTLEGSGRALVQTVGEKASAVTSSTFDALGEVTAKGLSVAERREKLKQSMTSSAVLANVHEVEADDNVALALMHEQKEHLFPPEYFGTMMVMLDQELDEVLGALVPDGEQGGVGDEGDGAGPPKMASMTKRVSSMFGGSAKAHKEDDMKENSIVLAIQTLRKDTLEVSLPPLSPSTIRPPSAPLLSSHLPSTSSHTSAPTSSPLWLLSRPPPFTPQVQRMKEEATEAEHTAAMKVQAQWRGRVSRQMTKELRVPQLG